MTRFNFVNMPRNSANPTWTGQGGPTWFINLSDASFTIRGNTTPLKGVTQLGIRESIKGKTPASAPGRRTESTGAGLRGSHRTSRDMELYPGEVEEVESRIGGRLRQPMTKDQERLKRKREKEREKSYKGLHRNMGGVVRKGDGGGDQRKRQRLGKMSSERVINSIDSASEDSVGDSDELDDDLDDLEKELDEMDNSDCDSIKAGMSPIGDRKGQKVSSSSEEGEEDDPDGAESDDSVGAATLEFERFLQSFEGGDNPGEVQTVRGHDGVIAVGTEDSEAGTDARSRRVGETSQTLEDGCLSDVDDSTPQQGTMPPVHVEAKAPEAANDRRYLGGEAGEGSGAVRRGMDHLSGDERLGPPQRKRCPGGKEGEGGASPVAPPEHRGPSGDCSKKEKTDEIEEEVDSDLERDLDGMLDEGAGSSDHDLEPESDKRKSDGEELVEKRGSGAANMLFDEELEDVSSYSDEESGNEDAIEDIEGFLAQI